MLASLCKSLDHMGQSEERSVYICSLNSLVLILKSFRPCEVNNVEEGILGFTRDMDLVIFLGHELKTGSLFSFNDLELESLLFSKLHETCLKIR